MKWRLVVIVLAGAALLLPLPPVFVERAYSTSVFPLIQSTLTRASNLTAFAWFDVLVLVSLVLLAGLSARDFRQHRAGRALVRIAARLTTAAAAVYLAFLACWGLNYQRQPLRDKVRFDASRITAAAVQSLARESVAQLNQTYSEARRHGFPAASELSESLASSFTRTAASLHLAGGIVPARPKQSLIDLYFRRAGVAGMTDPFFLETLVASDLLPFERPMVVAHEWAHLAGVTDEGEANFVGWLSCVRGATSAQYSAWLFLYSEVMSTVPLEQQRVIGAGLDAGPRADLEEIRRRYAREVNPRLSMAGWQVYDKYLKANRVDAGTASYGDVVRLVLGTDLR
ncbi:MAG TPA: DUF3810 family protein [Vicinamibacterales bacterium]|nr:DUF3810 family protein [Vicinamibacterales bacterium]